MHLSLEMILLALIIIIFNILDIITTNLYFKYYPDKTLKDEGNSLMRRLMVKNYKVADAVKIIGILCIIIYSLVTNNVNILRITTVLLGLIVLNNTYILLYSAITKQKKVHLGENLRKILRIPEKYTQLMIIVIMLGLSFGIFVLIW